MRTEKLEWIWHQQQGNSKRKTKPTETKPILEQDSNAPPDKSQSEMKAFLEQQDSNSLLEKSLITEIEESILTIS